MINMHLRRLGLKLAVFAMLALPEMVGAQFFNYNQYGDVLAGFRKTGAYQGNYELVVDLGNVTNFVGLRIGTTINITNLSAGALTDAFTNYANLQWSVFATFPQSSAWVTPLGSFPATTIWYTDPCVDVNTETTAPPRLYSSLQQVQQNLMNGVGRGALMIAGYLGTTNADNNTLLVREPVSYSTYVLTAFIGDEDDSTVGDFGPGGSPLPVVVENTTSNSFTSAMRSDFYQVCPTSSSSKTQTDPITGLTNGNAYFLGYFLFNANGTMTFTRAAAVVPAPVAGFSGSPTTGSAPLPVVFSDASTGTITNWLWTFGDGHSVTNSTAANVTNTYATTGNYTVSLTVSGPGGPNTSTVANYIVVASSAPVAGFTAAPTNGFAPLKVVFTDVSTGAITNWLWTFGDGHSVTNTVTGGATNTYAAAGTYTVSLKVTGSGGANTTTQTSVIAAAATPKLGGLALSGGKLVFSGTNCPVGVQYRILTSSNLVTWIPVVTNTFLANSSFAYTNNSPTNKTAFFRLVSP
jgi:PKD repeat protein